MLQPSVFNALVLLVTGLLAGRMYAHVRATPLWAGAGLASCLLAALAAWPDLRRVALFGFGALALAVVLVLLLVFKRGAEITPAQHRLQLPFAVSAFAAAITAAVA